MTNIIAKIDGHIIVTSDAQYNAAFKIIDQKLKDRKMHFDDSPFGCILYLCDAAELNDVLNTDIDKYYWTKKIITGKKINDKFDIIDYVQKSFARINQRKQDREWIPAKERIKRTREFNAFWNF